MQVFEGDLDEIDFLDMEHFMKLDYDDLIDLKLERANVKKLSFILFVHFNFL